MEFLGHVPSSEEVSRAITMPGGGAHKVAPGQITDDTEMALCLAHALAADSHFSLQRHVDWYKYGTMVIKRASFSLFFVLPENGSIPFRLISGQRLDAHRRRCVG